VVAGKSPSLSGSKSVVVQDLADFFVTDAAVAHLEDSAGDTGCHIIHRGSADCANPFLTLLLFDDLAAVSIWRPENEKALSNPFGKSFSYFSG
jgi:hypothetical protein